MKNGEEESFQPGPPQCWVSSCPFGALWMGPAVCLDQPFWLHGSLCLPNRRHTICFDIRFIWSQIAACLYFVLRSRMLKSAVKCPAFNVCLPASLLASREFYSVCQRLCRKPRRAFHATSSSVWFAINWQTESKRIMWPYIKNPQHISSCVRGKRSVLPPCYRHLIRIRIQKVNQ